MTPKGFQRRPWRANGRDLHSSQMAATNSSVPTNVYVSGIAVLDLLAPYERYQNGIIHVKYTNIRVYVLAKS